jgi:hypothetical protein
MEQTLNLNKLIALFLAETIRSRRTSLSRAAEISSQVVSRLPSISSEDQALAMLTEIEKDFEEVTDLKQALHFGYEPSEMKVYEGEIKNYASKIFEHDIQASNAFLQDAALPGMTIQQLCLKYPDFCRFLLSSPDKAKNLQDLQLTATNR